MNPHDDRDLTHDDDTHDTELDDVAPMLPNDAPSPHVLPRSARSKLSIPIMALVAVSCWLVLRTASSSTSITTRPATTQLSASAATADESSITTQLGSASVLEGSTPHKLRHTNIRADDSSSSADLEVFQPRKLHIFSFADSAKHEVCLLASSTARFGYELNMLAWEHSEKFADGTTCGDKCKRAANYRHGQERKIEWQTNLFQNHEKYGIHEDDLILFTDAFDVIVQNNLTLVTELFLRHTKNRRGIVFNAEATCGDSFLRDGSYGTRVRGMEFDVKLNRGGTTRKYKGDMMCTIMAAKTTMHNNVAGPYYGLSSGGFVGDLRSLKAFLVKIKEIADENAALAAQNKVQRFEGDQMIFQIAYLRYPELEVYVDSDASIFYVLSYLTKQKDFSKFDPKDGCANDYMADSRPSWLRFGETVPVFFHFPGSYRGHMKKCVVNLEKQAKEGREGFPKDPHFFDFDRQKRIPVTDICKEWGK